MKVVYAKCNKCNAVFAAACTPDGVYELACDYMQREGVTVSISDLPVTIRKCGCTLPSSLPELPAVETGIYTFDAAANAVLDRILNRFDIPFEGGFFEAIDAIAEYISKIAPAVETKRCPDCNGTGVYHEPNYTTCETCHGCGMIAPVEAETCVWELQSYGDYETTCKWTTSKPDRYSFCPYCGRPLTIK